MESAASPHAPAPGLRARRRIGRAQWLCTGRAGGLKNPPAHSSPSLGGGVHRGPRARRWRKFGGEALTRRKGRALVRKRQRGRRRRVEQLGRIGGIGGGTRPDPNAQGGFDLHTGGGRFRPTAADVSNVPVLQTGRSCQVAIRPITGGESLSDLRADSCHLVCSRTHFLVPLSIRYCRALFLVAMVRVACRENLPYPHLSERSRDDFPKPGSHSASARPRLRGRLESHGISWLTTNSRGLRSLGVLERTSVAFTESLNGGSPPE